ncbi:MAG: glycoside hydrolase family 127 protein, partial [Massilibacteroides sp.]|nr:glycoside hydrolase family 127 protein [Massilibacteroides sp.]
TGGIGSRAQGEGFGPDYELNNFNNYCETCASIANVYWNQRMFLATGESKYVDVLERTLYNGVMSGVSLSGDKFFYDNPLASDGHAQRAPWFGCACCPGNVTRFVASVPGYTYAVDKNDIYVNLYVEGNSKLKVGEKDVELIQKTQYPWDGHVQIAVNPTEAATFALLLRIPGWAQSKPVPTDLYKYVDRNTSEVKILLNKKSVNYKTRGGYAVLERQWKAGDVVSIEMAMPVRRVQANEKVEYDKGLLAMERGPVVYALESIDQGKDYVFDIIIPRDSKIESHYEKELLNGVTVLEGEAYRVIKDSLTGGLKEAPFRFKAIPYSTWNNRGLGQLVVWTPEKSEYAIVQPEPTVASKARQIGGWGMNDQFEPKSSSDLNTPYQYWWLKSGSEESVGYKFEKPETVSSVEVYWLAFEHYDVIYKEPESWKLLYKSGDEWKEVEATSPYGTELNKYNKVTFKPVTTTELKIIAQLQRPKTDKVSDEKGPQVIDVGRRGYSGGIIEWKVN